MIDNDERNWCRLAVITLLSVHKICTVLPGADYSAPNRITARSVSLIGNLLICATTYSSKGIISVSTLGSACALD